MNGAIRVGNLTSLLEWLDVETDMSSGNDPILKADRWAFQQVKKAIESGTFDLSPTDVAVNEIKKKLIQHEMQLEDWPDAQPKYETLQWYIATIRQLLAKNAEFESTIGELNEEHNQKHARNERLEKELAEEREGHDLVLRLLNETKSRLNEKEAKVKIQRKTIDLLKAHIEKIKGEQP